MSDVNHASDLIKKKRMARFPRPVRYAHLFQSFTKTNRPTKRFNSPIFTPASSHNQFCPRSGPYCIFSISSRTPMIATRLHLDLMLRNMNKAIHSRKRARARKNFEALKMMSRSRKLFLPLDCLTSQPEIQGPWQLSVKAKDRVGQRVKGG